jgi:nitrilase
MSKRDTAKLAAVQAAPVWLNRDATIEKACRLIREAGKTGADLIGFPENFIPGHPVWYYFYPATSEKSLSLATNLFKNSVEIPSPQVDALCRAAAEAAIYVVIGLTERMAGSTGTLYNTQLFINASGQIVGKHQKLVPTIGERLVHTGGQPETQTTFSSPFGQISGLACGENSNPFAVSMVAAAYTTIHVASWPNHFIPAYCGMRESSLLASRNIAYMCKCFVISSCGTNSEEMIKDLTATKADEVFLRDKSKTGGSCIIDPRAEVIAGPMDGDVEGILYADADFDACIRGRMVHDVAGHYNRSDVYRLLVNNSPSGLVFSSQNEANGAQIDPSYKSVLTYVEGREALDVREPAKLFDETGLGNNSTGLKGEMKQ